MGHASQADREHLYGTVARRLQRHGNMGGGSGCSPLGPPRRCVPECTDPTGKFGERQGSFLGSRTPTPASVFPHRPDLDPAFRARCRISPGPGPRSDLEPHTACSPRSLSEGQQSGGVRSPPSSFQETQGGGHPWAQTAVLEEEVWAETRGSERPPPPTRCAVWTRALLAPRRSCRDFVRREPRAAATIRSAWGPPARPGASGAPGSLSPRPQLGRAGSLHLEKFLARARGDGAQAVPRVLLRRLRELQRPRLVTRV